MISNDIRLLRCLLILFGMVGHFPKAALAQGTLEDYRRSDTVRERFSDAKVPHRRITPIWEPGGWRFLYHSDLRAAGRPWWFVDPETGRREALSEREDFSQALQSRKLDKTLEIQEVAWVREGRLRFRSGKTVWEWTVGAETLEPSEWPASRERSRSNRGERERISPDGIWRVELRDHNVHLKDLASDDEIPLSQDGREGDAYGGAVRWSPDSRFFVVFRTRAGDGRQIHLIESSPKDQLQPKLHSLNYTKPGDAIDQPVPVLFEVGTKKQVILDASLFPNPWRLSDLTWAPDSQSFSFLYNQRGHQVMRLLRVEVPSGKVRTLFEEISETFIDWTNKIDLRRLKNGKEILWMSERSGWNHLYLFDGETGALKHPVTQGDWVVRSVDRVDEDKRQVWFWASGIHADQDPYYLHYCRAGLDGGGMEVLTRGHGTHSLQWSPDRRCFIDTWSRVDLAPVHVLRNAEDGEPILDLEKADWSELVQAGWSPPERFVHPGRDGKTPIHGIIIRPSQYDPKKKYPVVEDIYAGPHGSFTPKSFGVQYRMKAIAELGFIVVKLDGMGTSHRSKAFHDVCWKNLGDSGFPDRMIWIRAAADRYPQMDLTRVGIYGGSAGGQSSTRALLAHGDFYHVAVSDCGCHDNRMDKIWWNEQWMGWPLGPHYEEQSNVTQAHRLTGKLLLVVGELDRNVDPSSTLQVVNALIRADKDFDFLLIPGAGHGAAETPYGTRRRKDFLVRHLLGVEPRHDP